MAIAGLFFHRFLLNSRQFKLKVFSKLKNVSLNSSKFHILTQKSGNFGAKLQIFTIQQQKFTFKLKDFLPKLKDFPPKLKDSLPKLKDFVLNSRIREIHLLETKKNR